MACTLPSGTNGSVSQGSDIFDGLTDAGDVAEASLGLSVVVATRRRPELLRRCVDALLDQDTDVPYEVVLVNDDDQPLAAVSTDPRVRCIDGRGRGAASARNLGVVAARGALVAFTDDDTMPVRGWLRALVRASDAAPEAAGFEGPVFVGPFDPLYFHAPIAGPGTCCGANVAYRRSTLDRTGGFDERFTGWMPEDIDLGLRAQRVGPVEYVSEMVVEHPPRPVGFRELVLQSRTVEGQWLLFRKHPSLSRWRTPLRWAPAVHAFRRWIRLLGQPTVVRWSPARAARIVALAVASGAVALVAGWRRWPGSV